MSLPTKKYQNINLNVSWINQRVSPDVINVVREGDVGGRTLVFNFTDQGSPVDFTGCTAMLCWKHTQEHISGIANANIFVNQISVPIPTSMQVATGEVVANLRITDNTGAIIMSTRTFRIGVEKSGIDSTAVLMSDQYSALDQLIITFNDDIASIPLTVNDVPVSIGSRNILLTADDISMSDGSNLETVVQQLGDDILQTPLTVNQQAIDVNRNIEIQADQVPMSDGSNLETTVNGLGAWITQHTSEIETLQADQATTQTQVDNLNGSNIPLTAGGASIDSAYTTLAGQVTTNSTDIANLGTASSYNVGTSVGEIPVVASTGTLPVSVIPVINVNQVFTGLDADKVNESTAVVGDMYISTDTGATYILQSAPPSTASNWVSITVPTSGVTAINNLTGAVTLVSPDNSITINGDSFMVNWGSMPNQTPYMYQNGDSVYKIADGMLSAGVATNLTSMTDLPSEFGQWVTSPLNFTAIYRGDYSPTNLSGNGTITLYQSDTNVGFQTTVNAGTWSPWAMVATVNSLGTFVNGARITFSLTSTDIVITDSQSGTVIYSGAYDDQYNTTSSIIGTVTGEFEYSQSYPYPNGTLTTFTSATPNTLSSLAVQIDIPNESTLIPVVYYIDLDSSAMQSEISALQNDMTTVESDISTLNTDVATNTANIATNTANIASNTSSISTLNTDVATNTSNIVTNTANIATNTTSIANIVSGATTVGRASQATTATTATSATTATTATTATQISMSITATTTTNIDTLSQKNIYVPSTITPLGTPPWTGVDYMVTQYYQDGTHQAQLAINLSAGSSGNTKTRGYDGSAWTTWQTMAVSNGAIQNTLVSQYSSTIFSQQIGSSSLDAAFGSSYIRTTDTPLGTLPYPAGTAYYIDVSINANNGGFRKQVAYPDNTGIASPTLKPLFRTTQNSGTTWTAWQTFA